MCLPYINNGSRMEVERGHDFGCKDKTFISYLLSFLLIVTSMNFFSFFTF